MPTAPHVWLAGTGNGAVWRSRSWQRQRGQQPQAAAGAGGAAGGRGKRGREDARGARQQDGRAVHLVSALDHRSGLVVAQRDGAHKANEILEVRTLLEPLDLRGRAVTLDALRCQKETARFLVEDKKAACVFTAAKDNQPGLVAALDALP